ncbi:MAG: PepSY-associated TM helix domain-containing protein [Candidatus Binatia bacterium]
MKKFWFQIHWLLGISAGLVLMVMGVSGAVLSFEHDLLEWLNPGVMTVTPCPEGPLSPHELVTRIQSASPEKRVIGLQFSSAPMAAARVNFASSATGPSERGQSTKQTELDKNQEQPGTTVRDGQRRSERQRGGSRRGEWRYVDPYTAALLGEPRGQEFFRFMTELHRWLALGELVKAITGVSTVAFVVLCLSGLYLRWPRRIWNWRAWLRINFALRGRSFLWHLHAISGTWVLPLYLLAGLTGLFWSYEWYRAGLFALTGAPPPNRERIVLDAPVTEPPHLTTIWTTFLREVGKFKTVNVSLPERPTQALEIRYLEDRPAHDRAFSQLVLHPTTGAVMRHDRYAERPFGVKLVNSMFVLHSGSFFGVVGWALMMAASLVMPLFAITGWQLYLARRTRKRASLIDLIGSEKLKNADA